MTRNMSGPSVPSAGSDDVLNEKFHVLLREAAERRAERALVQSSGDLVAAGEELAGFLALARSSRGGRASDDPGRSGRPA